MAKITFINPEEAKGLATGGDVIYTRQGQIIVRPKPHGPFFFSTPKQRAQQLFDHIAVTWWGLTQEQYDHWKEYIPYAPNSIHPWNALITCNMRGLYPNIPQISDINDISSPDQSPHIPTNLKLKYNLAGDHLKITWKDDYGPLIFIQTAFFTLPGRRTWLKYWWKLHSWAPSSVQFSIIPGSKFVAGSREIATIRALNIRGEVSPWAEPEEEEIPPPPFPNFTAAPRSGGPPLTVTFFNLSSGAIRSQTWAFGDGQYSTEQAPVHTYYQQSAMYDPKLTLDGPADSHPFLQRWNYIRTGKIRDLWVSDTNNHRIVERWVTNLAFSRKWGTYGSGPNQLNGPWGACADQTHIYIADSSNHRIMKRLIEDWSLVAIIGSNGSGNDQFKYPGDIDVDETYIYVMDYGNHRIVKRLKSDLSYISQFGSFGTGNNNFYYPFSIACDDTYLYIPDFGNHRIKKHLKSNLSFVSKIGTVGQGVDQFVFPQGISCNATHIFVSDTNNHRIHKRLKSNLSYVQIIGSQGSGNDQFNFPHGNDATQEFLYIADRNNHRIQKRKVSDLSFVDKIGSLGSGDDQFNQPRGITLQSLWA